jgi:sigma-B regulation protein RsbU (phosphoserine phosphatase)
MVSGRDDDRTTDEGAMLATFVESSRRAESFRQAIASALATVRETLDCESAWLLEKGSPAGSESRYRPIVGDGDERPSLPANGLLLGRLRHYPFPLPLTPADFDTWSEWSAAAKVEHASEIDCLRKTGARLAVPLLARNEIPGILLLGAPIGRGRFSTSEQRLLQHCAAQFALMVENAHLTDRIVEQEKLRRDVHLAAEVQKRLLPDAPPATKMVALAGRSLPARSIGGDYYDFLDLGGGRIGIALADVAGKGVSAALIMSVVQASLRILASEEGVSLTNLAGRMNHFLHRATGSTGSSSYATFFYAEIDSEARRLRYVNAGHNPPFLLRYAPTADRIMEELPASGTVIGLFPQSSYQEAAVDLGPGDVLMAFTDGVIEALNPADEEYGEERLRALLRKSGHLPVEAIASQIAGELKTWIGEAAQYDDLTFILLKVNAVLPCP